MPAKQQIAGAVHQLHAVVAAATVGMVLSGATLPGLVHLGLAEPAGTGQMQALAGEDCIKIGVLAQWAPVGLAERWAALATGFALSTLARATATKADLLTAEQQQAWRERLGGWGYDPLLVSAHQGEGISELRERLSQGLNRTAS